MTPLTSPLAFTLLLRALLGLTKSYVFLNEPPVLVFSAPLVFGFPQVLGRRAT
jgi:hypothetical protein